LYNNYIIYICSKTETIQYDYMICDSVTGKARLTALTGALDRRKTRLTSAVIGMFCFLALVLCWSTFNMMTAYARVKAASTLANGSPLVFCNNNVMHYVINNTLSDFNIFIPATGQDRADQWL